MNDLFRIISTRKNRSSGSEISLIHDEVIGWITLCETHSINVEHSTRRLATEWMAAPEVWCEGCRAEIEKKRFGRAIP